MKKIIIAIILCFVLAGLSKNNETLRIRVLANSNSEYDQKVKSKVVEIVKKEFKDILGNANNIDEAREKINANLDQISNKVDTFLNNNKISYGSKVNFGLNYFPNKKYNGKSYSEGYYESVLITLGKGEGDNWWCILFPSVCLTEDNVKYESFLKNIFDKLF